MGLEGHFLKMVMVSDDLDSFRLCAYICIYSDYAHVQFQMCPFEKIQKCACDKNPNDLKFHRFEIEPDDYV